MNNEIIELIEELKYSYGIAMPKQEYFGYIKGIEDYITNLQTIEREYSAVLSENAELQEENERLKLNGHQLKQKLEAKNKRIKTIKDILNGRSDE